MSRFETDYDFDPPKVSDVLLPASTSKTGLVRFTTTFGNNDLEFPYNAEYTTSICNQVYAQPLNFRVRDFIDHKTLNANRGRLSQYEKVSLAEIHVEVELHTKKGSAFDNEWYMIKWAAMTQPTVAEMRGAKKDLTWNPQYLVYRDANGDYSTQEANIAFNTEYTTPATEMQPSRKLQSLRKKDQTTDIVTKGFSFTRKITSGGPYYLTPQKIWELKDDNIALLINEIEGQSADSTGNLVKWPEFFNFLVAPLNSDMVMCPIGTTTAVLTPNFHTEVHVKTSATWLAMQNSQVSGTVGFSAKSDPYYKAQVKTNLEIARAYGTH